MPLLSCLLALQLPSGETPRLRIDPLLVAAVTEAFQVIAREDNPVWPGWNAKDTPILLYLPDVQDALINHPRPPEGFRRVDSPLLPAGWTLDLRDGKTVFSLDGQNTSTDVNGIETLVVADPVSNVRPQIALLLDDPRPADERARELTAERLSMDPYDQLAMVVHEAFHVHQFRKAPGKSASEALLLQYPWLSAENNALFALEGQCLERGLATTDVDGAFEAALEWLGVRHERRAKLPAAAVQYEDGTEFNEGLAKYVEWRASEVLEGREPGPGLRWARGFDGFGDLRSWRARLRQQLRGNTSGETIVNGDPYGSGCLRFRLYYTGMAIGALLDRLEAEGWHERMLESGATLTGLVQEVLAAPDEELEAAAERAKERGGYATLLAAKRKLEQDGQAAADAAAKRILEGPALLTLDFSGVDAAPGLGFTPFGLTRVDAARTIYGQIPMQGGIGSAATFQQTATSPILVDVGAKKLCFQLARPLEPGELARLLGVAKLGDAALAEASLALPGVSLQARKAVVRAVQGGVEIALVR